MYCCVQLLPIHTLRLGVELDSFDGHHYISSVAPGGPVDKHGVLRPEDELLEVEACTHTDTVGLNAAFTGCQTFSVFL